MLLAKEGEGDGDDDDEMLILMERRVNFCCGGEISITTSALSSSI